MSTTKHTPGPWKMDIPAPKSRSATVRSLSGKPVAEVMKPGLAYDDRELGPIYPSEYQANAALIAAAPEMLEALKQLLRSFPCPLHSTHKTGCVHCEKRKASEAIVAKAEGR